MDKETPAIEDDIKETQLEKSLEHANEKISKLEKCMKEKDKRIGKIENIHRIVKGSAIVIGIIAIIISTYGILIKALHIIHSNLPEIWTSGEYGREVSGGQWNYPALCWSFYGISVFAVVMLTIIWIWLLTKLIEE